MSHRQLRNLPLPALSCCLALLSVLFFSCKKTTPTVTFSPLADTIGSTITLTGLNFGNNPNSVQVFFAGIGPAQIVHATANELSVIVPPNSADGKITVVINGAVFKSATDFMISPLAVPNAEGVGYPVTLYGRGFFSATPSGNTVKFNGTSAVVTAASVFQLTVTVPEGATNGPISVTVNGQTLSTQGSFTVLPEGDVTTLAGSGAAGDVDSTGTAASFNQPEGLATDNAGNIYVADYGSHKIRLITPDAKVSTFAGTSEYMNSNPNVDGPKFTAYFGGLSSLLLAGDSNTIYVTDLGGNRVREIKSGTVSTLSNNSTIPTTIYFEPSGISMDAKGNLFFANQGYGNIEEITAAGVAQLYADQRLSQFQGGSQLGGLYLSAATAIDAVGNLYLADMGTFRILKFTPSGFVSVFAGGGSVVAGDGQGTQAAFGHPAALAFDPQGNLFVADILNNEIRRIDPSGNVSTIAGNPNTTGSSDGRGPGASFNQPSGITVDKNGIIYVSEAGSNKIRKITLH